MKIELWLFLGVLGFTVFSGCTQTPTQTTPTSIPSFVPAPTRTFVSKTETPAPTATLKRSFPATWTNTPEGTPTATPTCEPSVVEKNLMNLWKTPNPSSNDEMHLRMVETFGGITPDPQRGPFVFSTNPIFDIEFVPDTPNPNWILLPSHINPSETLKVFGVYVPDILPTEASDQEFHDWLQSGGFIIQDLTTGKGVRLRWTDYMPYRPIEFEGWLDDDVFTFSQFGNPWHGFLVAVDARKKKVVETIQIEFDLC